MCVCVCVYKYEYEYVCTCVSVCMRLCVCVCVCVCVVQAFTQQQLPFLATDAAFVVWGCTCPLLIDAPSTQKFPNTNTCITMEMEGKCMRERKGGREEERKGKREGGREGRERGEGGRRGKGVTHSLPQQQTPSSSHLQYLMREWCSFSWLLLGSHCFVLFFFLSHLQIEEKELGSYAISLMMQSGNIKTSNGCQNSLHVCVCV